MRWTDERQSDNIEDRRGMSGGKIAIGGVGGVIVLLIALLCTFVLVIHGQTSPLHRWMSEGK